MASEERLETDTPRVLWINPWDKRIGPNRYLADMLAADRALAEHSMIVLAQEGAAAQEYRAIGCEVEIWKWATLVHLARTRANAARVLQTHTRGVQFARKRLRALAPAVVITNSENMWFGGMAARSLGIPHLQVFHALTLEYHWRNRPRLVREYLRWLELWSAKLIGVSQTLTDMLTRNGVPAARVAKVCNGLNLEQIRTERAAPLPPAIQTRVQGHSPILVTLGRISAMKGHDLLIEALAHVKSEFPNMLCLLGGAVLSAEGVEDTNAFYARLKERIDALDLREHVIFLDEVDYAPALVRCADVYVQPSRTESFCRAAAEALARGVPVAAFRAGALPEVLGEGALLVPPEDVNALGGAIVCLLKDAGLRAETVAAGQAHIQQFEVLNSTRALRMVLDDAVKEGKGH